MKLSPCFLTARLPSSHRCLPSSFRQAFTYISPSFDQPFNNLSPTVSSPCSSFVDRSPLRSLSKIGTKVVVSKDAPGFDAVSNCGGVGASVSVSGVVVASKGKGQEVEIKADEVEVRQVLYGILFQRTKLAKMSFDTLLPDIYYFVFHILKNVSCKTPQPWGRFFPLKTRLCKLACTFKYQPAVRSRTFRRTSSLQASCVQTRYNIIPEIAHT